ncbi:MAG: carboxypeptidase regulatory-like domain-containing protein [Candidatus Electrothrix sp. GM3_4]|nr:carboxypeptidase regulatory-like domain-containing protein [Candidatus Electrothrix sp. GM3_4]
MKNILKSNQISKLSILFICILLVSITHEARSASFFGYVKKESAPAEGIGGVRVFVCTDPCGQNDWDENNFAVTDSTGRYNIIGLDEAEYKIKFFTWDATPYNYTSEWYNDQVDSALADPEIPTPAGLDLGTTLLSEGYTISGKVTNAEGTPLEGVHVYARSSTNIWFSIRDPGSTATLDGDSNNYTFLGLPPDKYNVLFSANEIGYISEWFNDQPTASTAEEVDVTLDNAIRVDAILGASETTSNFNWLLFLPTIIINTTKL